MAANKLMLSYMGFALLFALGGGLLMGFSISAESLIRSTPTVKNVAQDLLLGECPLTGTLL